MKLEEDNIRIVEDMKEQEAILCDTQNHNQENETSPTQKETTTRTPKRSKTDTSKNTKEGQPQGGNIMKPDLRETAKTGDPLPVLNQEQVKIKKLLKKKRTQINNNGPPKSNSATTQTNNKKKRKRSGAQQRIRKNIKKNQKEAEGQLDLLT